MARSAGPWAELPADLAEALRQVEAGDCQGALRSLARAPAGSGLARRLIEARAALGIGDAIGALRALEAARAEAPLDPEVAASACEILVALGRFDGAAAELQAGLDSDVGSEAHPALVRARGCYWLARGDAARARDALEQARAADARLPFVSAPLVRARVLCGRAQLAGPAADASPAERARALDAAEAHAGGALALAPLDLDARELLADVHAARGDLEAALALYEGVAAAGREPGVRLAELHCQAATACLLGRDRPAALGHWRRARELGLDGEALGFGAVALADEARAALERGSAAYADEDWTAAEAAFAAAARDAPEALEPLNHRALALFKLGRFAEAAAAWEEVLALAAASGAELPDPVHVHAIKALRNAGELGRALALARDYLAAHPGGPWLSETQAALAALEEAQRQLELGLATHPAVPDPLAPPRD